MESKYHRMRFYSGFLFIILAISIVASVYASKCNDGADCVKVSSFGFDSSDSTEFVQRALDSGARKVILDDCGSPWIVRPLILRSNVELVFEDCVELLAKSGEFRGTHDVLLQCTSVSNVIIRGLGQGGVLKMRKKDYQRPPYKKSEWRHALRLSGVENVLVENMSFVSSGGDGIDVCALKGYRLPVVNSMNVTIRKCVCDDNHRQGISVCGVENLLIEDVVLSGTSGTLPQAGIDFEPDRPSEGLSNITLRNVVSKNNSGMGFEFCLTKMKESSSQVSIRLENCVAIGNRMSVSVCGNDVRDGDTVKGRILFAGCRFQDSRENGIRLRGIPKDSLEVAFVDCEVSNAGKAEILFDAGTKRQGAPHGICFDGLKIVQPKSRWWFHYDRRSFGPLTEGVRGGVKVVGPDGLASNVVLDKGWIESNIPEIDGGWLPPPRMKFPSASAVEVHDAMPGEMAVLSEAVLIHRSRYAFFAPSPGPVKFKMRQVPRSSVDAQRRPPSNVLTVTAVLDGGHRGKSFDVPMPGFASGLVSFNVPQSGFYLLSAYKPQCRMVLEESSVPVAINVSEREQFVLLGREAFSLWFAPCFSKPFVLAASSRDGARFSVAVKSPQGGPIRRMEVSEGLGGVSVPADRAVSGLWQVDFARIGKRLSGWMGVDMFGAPGFYFLSKEKYWMMNSNPGSDRR